MMSKIPYKSLFIGLGIVTIISLSFMFALETQYKEIAENHLKQNNTTHKTAESFKENQISPTPADQKNNSNTPSPVLKVTLTPTTQKYTIARTPNPPAGTISWPSEGETINASEDTLCFIDAPTGGDQSSIQRRKNINNGGWETYIPVYPSSSTCFYPKEGENVFSIQFMNQYGEESSVYTRHFIFHKQTPTPTISSDTTPPVIDQISGPENGAIWTQDSFCYSVYVTDNISKSPNLWIRYKFEGGGWNEWTTNFSNCFTAYQNSQITFSIQAKDQAGNESAPTTRTFTVSH